MPAAPNNMMGSYQVLSLIGKGGMGEVYRARDPQLKRDVALKVLPAAFAGDPEFMARLQREAEVLASLDHPNIGVIYGMVESRALVLALVEGPTLAERIAAGPIPLEEALAIARQIIAALEYAHDRGVVHRDLKPANVKISPDGAIKVLDFGLAKVLEEERTSAARADSPTLTLGYTGAGVILGTAAYMSPEQAVGKVADRRSDIFSFGVVLYEMLTGRRAFTAESTPETLIAVAKDDPDWSKLPSEYSGRRARRFASLPGQGPQVAHASDRGGAHCARRVRPGGRRRSLLPGQSPFRAPAVVGRGSPGDRCFGCIHRSLPQARSCQPVAATPRCRSWT